MQLLELDPMQIQYISYTLEISESRLNDMSNRLEYKFHGFILGPGTGLVSGRIFNM